MIPLNIQCDCGQLYPFDMDLLKGPVASPLVCPNCGADGAAVADEFIAQKLSTDSAVPSGALTVHFDGFSQSPDQDSPKPAAKGSKDGWTTKESPLNELGMYVAMAPGFLLALFQYGFAGIYVSFATACIIVSIGGMVGGALSVAGRGPVLVGALVGVLVALGGYSTVSWWIHDRERVYKIEVIIAFAAGVTPGFFLQGCFQEIMGKRSFLSSR